MAMNDEDSSARSLNMCADYNSSEPSDEVHTNEVAHEMVERKEGRWTIFALFRTILGFIYKMFSTADDSEDLPDNTTQTKKHYKIILKTSNEPISSVVYTFKIPNFITLPEYQGMHFDINSPFFDFANATWRLRFESRTRSRSHLSETKDDSSSETKDDSSSETEDGSSSVTEDDSTSKREDDSSSETEDVSKGFIVYLVRLMSEMREKVIYSAITIGDYGFNYYDEYSFNWFLEGEEEMVLVVFNWNEDCISQCFRNDTLTVTIHLLCDEPTELDIDEEQTDKGISLSQDLKSALINGEGHNLTFSVGNKKFRAHQDILRARSEVFRSMLSHDMVEKKIGVVDVPDCDPRAFEQFLFYIYTGKIETIHENNMFYLYYLADKYMLAHLKEECSEFIMKSISVTNVCNAIECATKHSDATLLDSAMIYFFCYVDNILVTEEWKLFMAENPTVANELFIKSVKMLKDTTSSADENSTVENSRNENSEDKNSEDKDSEDDDSAK